MGKTSKRIEVLFNDPKHNYKAGIDGAASINKIKNYFVGNFFDVSNKQQCISVKIS